MKYASDDMKFYVNGLGTHDVLFDLPVSILETFDTLEEAKNLIKQLQKEFDEIEYTIYQGYILERGKIDG